MKNVKKNVKNCRYHVVNHKPVNHHYIKKSLWIPELIAQELGIFEYDSYETLPPAKKAWISIKADEYGINREEVHTWILNRFSEIARFKISRKYQKKHSVSRKKKSR